MKFAKVVFCLLALVIIVTATPVMADTVNVFELNVENGVVVEGEYQVYLTDTLTVNVEKSGTWESASVDWSSSDTGVAIVSVGIVIPQSTGSCSITATATNNSTGETISASIRVRVIGATPSPTVVMVRASGGGSVVEKGGTLQMLADVTPAGIDVEWSSSRPAIIAVDSDGLLTGLKKGKSIITATAVDGSGASDSMVVSVSVVPGSVTISKNRMELYVGGTTSKYRNSAVLTAAVKPAGASQSVIWSSGNNAIVTVGQKGRVTALKKGTATITATTINGLKDRCTVIVHKLPTVVWLPALKKVYVGKKLNLGSLLKINGDITTVTWASSNKKIARVNSKGVVLGIKPGQCRIGVKAVNGKSDVCVVNVYASKGLNDPELVDDEGVNDGMPTQAQLDAG